jgi:hypothetical protein
MASATYRLIRKAILAEQQITCHYNGHYRELCPHILGHTDSEKKLLAFQFGGRSSKPLPRSGEWRCLWLRRCATSWLATACGMLAVCTAGSKAALPRWTSTSTFTSATLGDATATSYAGQYRRNPLGRRAHKRIAGG